MTVGLSASLLDTSEREEGGAGRRRTAVLLLLALLPPSLGYCDRRETARDSLESSRISM